MRFQNPAEIVAGLVSRNRDSALSARVLLHRRCSSLVTRLLDRLIETSVLRPDPLRLRDLWLDNMLCNLEMNLKVQGESTFRHSSWEEFDAWVLLHCSRLTSVLQIPSEPFEDTRTGATPAAAGSQFSLGQTSHGHLVLRWFEQPREIVGGDWWAYEPLDFGALLVIVADVTDHGVLSYFLREGLPHLWRMCLDECTGECVTPGILAALLDRELASVFPECYFVDATVVRFDVQPASAVAICHGGRRLEITTEQGAYRGLISGGVWLGIGYEEFPLGDVIRSFPVDSGLVIGTDGLADQPVGSEHGGQRFLDLLWAELSSCETSQRMHDMVVERFRSTLRTSGHQPDDVCVVTVTAKGM